MKRILCALAALALPSLAHAYGFSMFDSPKTVFVGSGLVSANAGRMTNNPTGTVNMNTTVLPEINVSAYLGLGGDWTLSPFVSYTPLGHKSPEGGEKTTLLPIALRLGNKLGPFDFRVGPGLMYYTVSGNGGTVDLNNGTGTTTFGLPTDSQGARVFMMNGGLGLGLDRYRLDIDALVTDTFSSARRAVNLTANFSYGLF